jgi:hypothetical protein
VPTVKVSLVCETEVNYENKNSRPNILRVSHDCKKEVSMLPSPRAVIGLKFTGKADRLSDIDITSGSKATRASIACTTLNTDKIGQVTNQQKYSSDRNDRKSYDNSLRESSTEFLSSRKNMHIRTNNLKTVVKAAWTNSTRPSTRIGSELSKNKRRLSKKAVSTKRDDSEGNHSNETRNSMASLNKFRNEKSFTRKAALASIEHIETDNRKYHLPSPKHVGSRKVLPTLQEAKTPESVLNNFYPNVSNS